MAVGAAALSCRQSPPRVPGTPNCRHSQWMSGSSKWNTRVPKRASSASRQAPQVSGTSTVVSVPVIPPTASLSREILSLRLPRCKRAARRTMRRPTPPASQPRPAAAASGVYSEQSVLTRSCQRWCGRAPMQQRRLLRDASDRTPERNRARSFPAPRRASPGKPPIFRGERLARPGSRDVQDDASGRCGCCANQYPCRRCW